MNFMNRNFKAFAIFIGLSLSTAHVKPKSDNLFIKLGSTGLNIARIAVTYTAIERASGVEGRKQINNWMDLAVTAATALLTEAESKEAKFNRLQGEARRNFILADVLGLLRNGLVIVFDEDVRNAGGIAAISSSIMMQLIDLYVHLKDDKPYTEFTGAQTFGIIGVQLLRLVPTFLMFPEESQTCVYNIDAALQAAETYLISQHHISDISEDEKLALVLKWALASLAGINGISTTYYGVTGVRKRNATKREKADKEDKARAADEKWEQERPARKKAEAEAKAEADRKKREAWIREGKNPEKEFEREKREEEERERVIWKHIDEAQKKANEEWEKERPAREAEARRRQAKIAAEAQHLEAAINGAVDNIRF